VRNYAFAANVTTTTTTTILGPIASQDSASPERGNAELTNAIGVCETPESADGNDALDGAHAASGNDDRIARPTDLRVNVASVQPTAKAGLLQYFPLYFLRYHQASFFPAGSAIVFPDAISVARTSLNTATNLIVKPPDLLS
jgi:hypothetical protein